MTVSYTWVHWNKHKKIYDLIMLALSLIFVATFILTSTLLYKDDESISAMILAMRAFGILAIILLILAVADPRGATEDVSRATASSRCARA